MVERLCYEQQKMSLSTMLGNSKVLGALCQKPGIKTKYIFFTMSQFHVDKSCFIFKDEVFLSLGCQLNFNVCSKEKERFFYSFFIFVFILFYWCPRNVKIQ